jgi:hypothetical protein
MTADARDDDSVKAFRRVVLRGHLLKSHRVEHWIKRRAKREGSPTLFATRPSGAERVPQPHSEIASKLVPELTMSLKFLAYDAGDDWAHHVPIVAGGDLDFLRKISEELAKRYGWNRAYGTRFVLTDESPPISRATVTVRVKSPFQAAAKIVLEVSPRMTPDEVRARFIAARDNLDDSPGRVREISEKHAELAVFAFEHREGLRWVDVMAQWNRSYPQWSYDGYVRFNRDARQAYRRVTRDHLDWIGEPS